MVTIQSFVFGPFMENTYVLSDESGECIIIDPGCYEEHEKREVTNYIEKNDLVVKKIINTHGHIDHVLGNDPLKDHFKVPLFIHQAELPVYKAVITYASSYGFPAYREAEVDQFLEEGDQVSFGNSYLSVIFTPGHSPGHISLIKQDENICMSGDVLFKGSIGRTDLPGGHFDTLIESIHQKIFPLGDDMVVYSGHGPETTVGEEKVSNPFCALK